MAGRSKRNTLQTSKVTDKSRPSDANSQISSQRDISHTTGNAHNQSSQQEGGNEVINTQGADYEINLADDDEEQECDFSNHSPIPHDTDMRYSSPTLNLDAPKQKP